MFTPLDFTTSLDDEGNAVVLLTLGGEATPEYVAELTRRLNQEFDVTPK